MQIRLATPDDHETIAALWLESRLPTVDLEEWDSLIASPNAMVLLAEDEGALSGAVVASFDGWRAYIYHIAVVPGRRQTGVATTLMREAEARLQALQARIRPHFLFNSLNAVLSLVRRDPRRAERALEDLADVFRTLMSEPRQFVRLADEIALLERYAGIEQLRLGERLRITWELDAAPSDALLPPLVLQPLLENAVFHGVEPGTAAGEVLVHIERRGDRVLARIENPYVADQQRRVGNRMALENIRERLALFFDAEARIRTSADGRRYRVEIEIPYKSERAS